MSEPGTCGKATTNDGFNADQWHVALLVQDDDDTIVELKALDGR